MEQLIEIQRIILEEFETFFLDLDKCRSEKITLDNRINGVVGSRGVGKMTGSAAYGS